MLLLLLLSNMSQLDLSGFQLALALARSRFVSCRLPPSSAFEPLPVF